MFSIILAGYLLQATYVDLYNDGHMMLDQGKVKEAETALKRSVSLNQTYAPALKDLAETYVKLKRIPDAIDIYQKIIWLNSKDINARGRLAELYSWTGNHDKSIVTYRDALDVDPNNLMIKNGLATVLRWSHRYEEAERIYKDVLNADPENHEALKGLGKTYSMTGDLTDAVYIDEKATRLFPEDAELQKEIGTVLAWQKDFKKAIGSLKKAVELAPNYVEAYRTLGDAYSWMKSYQQAVDSYRKAKEIEPENIENHILLASAYKSLGNRTQAEEAIKAALKLDPSDTRALQLFREIREEGKYKFINGVGEAIELSAFISVFVVILFLSKTKKKILKRRHRAYFYLFNFAMPALVGIVLASYIGKDFFSRWLNISFIEETTEALLYLALSISFFAVLWTENRSKDFNKMVILAIGAHPDDIELGCGGFIMKAKDSGATVYGLTLTKGEKGNFKDARREDEQMQAARYMELNGYWLLDFPDTGLNGMVTDIKDVIEQKISETGATVILTHSSLDIHSDHQAVFDATKVAARNYSVLCYEDVSTPREFVPNYFVDVTGYIEDKMNLICFHKTQEDKAYMDPEVVKGRAAHRGIQCGLQYAEAFRVYKLVR